MTVNGPPVNPTAGGTYTGAIVLRVLLAGLAGTMLALPGLKLIGGLLLALLALNLVLPDHREASVSPLGEQSDVVAAAVLVMLFDLLMSLDNVLALVRSAGTEDGNVEHE